MGNTPGKVSYEYRKGMFAEKTVAAEVVVKAEDEVKKSVAEDLVVPDPVESEKVIAENLVDEEEVSDDDDEE